MLFPDLLSLHLVTFLFLVTVKYRTKHQANLALPHWFASSHIDGAMRVGVTDSLCIKWRTSIRHSDFWFAHLTNVKSLGLIPDRSWKTLDFLLKTLAISSLISSLSMMLLNQMLPSNTLSYSNRNHVTWMLTRVINQHQILLTFFILHVVMFSLPAMSSCNFSRICA